MRKAIGAFSWVIVLALSAVRASCAQTPPDAGEPAVAERVADIGKSALRGGTVTTANFRLCAALLEAATKLSPAEPRFPRLWADAALQAGDADDALRAIKAYVALVPDDKAALVELADLYARSYQTMDAKLHYLESVVDVAGLPEVVRSHVAFLMYQAYVERAQTASAKAALDKALTLNPLSLEALHAKSDMQGPDAAPADRLATLLAMLKSNPGQLREVSAVAQVLSDAGLATESLTFYARGVDLAQRQGVSLPLEYVLAYAAELSLVSPADRPNAAQAAKQLTDFLVKADPSYFDGLTLQLILQRAAGQKDDAAKTTQQALVAVSNRLQAVRGYMGEAGATTRPSDSTDAVTFGALDEDVKRLKDLKPTQAMTAEQIRSAYRAAVSDAAWFEIYFNNKPADAKPLIDALRQIEPENSPLVTRLDGWSFLARGEKDQAKVKLSAVKDKEPLAELGLLKIAGAAGKKDGEAFLAAHADGMLAAQAMDALREFGVTLIPEPQLSARLTEALKAFPMAWLTVVESPQSFYSLRAEPLKPAYNYGEPILVRVTLQNTGDVPITIGPEGVVHADLWFDCGVRGAMASAMQKNFPATAVDRLGREAVLQPKQSVSQIMRVDQGDLQKLLSENPAPAIDVTFDVRTNPTTTGVGPAGQVANGVRAITRVSFPLSPENFTKLATSIQQGTPPEKIRNLDLATQVVQLINSLQGNPEAPKIIRLILDALKGATTDAVPSVQAWGSKSVLPFLQPAERLTFLGRLANDPYWLTRMIGLTSMSSVPVPDQRAILKQVIDHDTNAIVVSVAKNLSTVIEQAAANAPAGQAPATQPTTAPQSPLTSSGLPSTKPAGIQVEIPKDIPLTLPPPAAPSPKVEN